MTPCARGCCRTSLGVCYRQRTCHCHRDDHQPPPQGSDARRHADPTANEAIRNAMRNQERKK